MKRFYTTVGVEPIAGGYAIVLDGRPVRTPQRAPLSLPTHALADAVAAEWAEQVDDIRPGEMRLTGLSNAAIDIMKPDLAAMQAMLGAYAETDALVYRGDDPALVARQVQLWNPLLDWAERIWSIQFAVTSGITHVAQPPETVAALRNAVNGLDAWRLAALSPLTTIGGSLVVALGVEAGAISANDGWDAVILEEVFQEERWGTDDEALKARSARRRDWDAAARFATLLRT